MENLKDNQIPGSEAKETLSAAISQARALVSEVRKNGCGAITASKLIKSASKISKSLNALGLKSSIKASIPDLHLSASEQDTCSSLEEYISGCKKACGQIQTLQDVAGRKLAALAEAVEECENPSMKKVNAHLRSIMSSLKAGLYDGGAYSQQEEIKEIRQEARETAQPSVQNRTLSSALDWDLVAAKLGESVASTLRSTIGRYKYSILEDLRSSLKRGTESNEFKKNKIQEELEEEPEVIQEHFNGDLLEGEDL